MATNTKNKGQETKNKILRTARRLFFEKGYQATSCSAISEAAGTNLGLINYYFEGKGEIGMLIYTDIRAAFDKLTEDFEPELTGVSQFLFSCAVELYLCLYCEPFGRFYYELTSEPAFREKVEMIIINVLMKYTQRTVSQEQALLSCLSIMAIKPALVNYARQNPGQIEPDAMLRYYVEQQISVLGLPPQYGSSTIDTLKKYYLNLADCFTPVMTPLLQS